MNTLEVVVSVKGVCISFFHNIRIYHVKYSNTHSESGWIYTTSYHFQLLVFSSIFYDPFIFDF